MSRRGQFPNMCRTAYVGCVILGLVGFPVASPGVEQETRLLIGHTNEVLAIAFSPDAHVGWYNFIPFPK